MATEHFCDTAYPEKPDVHWYGAFGVSSHTCSVGDLHSRHSVLIRYMQAAAMSLNGSHDSNASGASPQGEGNFIEFLRTVTAFSVVAYQAWYLQVLIILFSNVQPDLQTLRQVCNQKY